MSRFNTGNNLNSLDERDFYDNCLSLDQAMNSTEPTWRDRFNVEKPTIDAALKSAGFMPAGFDFVTGGTLQPGDRNKAVYNPAPNGDNNWYRWNGAFPKEIADNSQPNPKDENNWVPVIINVEDNVSVSFVFDDALLSHFDVVAPLSNSYGFKCGFAIPYQYLTGGTRMSGQQLIAMRNSGHEILNHATTGGVMSSNTLSKQKVRGELATCWSMLHSIGIETIGFQTPSSVLHDDFQEIIPGFSNYAFTKPTSVDPLIKDTNPHKLWRYSLESNSAVTIVDSLRNLKNSKKGAICFYAHDIQPATTNYDRLVAALNFCRDNGIPVLTPSQSIQRSIIPLPETKMTFSSVGIIDKDISGYKTNVPGNAITTSANGRDITLNLSTDQPSCLLQKTLNLTGNELLLDKLYNYSVCIRKTQQSFGSCAIGVRFYSGENLTGTLLHQIDEEPFEPDNYDVRYYVSAFFRGQTPKSVHIYIRFNGITGGDCLIREPVMRIGTSVNPGWLEPKITQTYFPPTTSIHTVPTEIYGPSTNWVDVKLDNVETDYFKITDNKTIVFKVNGLVSIDLSLVTSGTGGISGATAGVIQCVTDVGGCNNRPVIGNATLMSAGTGITKYVTKSETLRFRIIVNDGSVTMSNATSRLTVSYLGNV